MSLIFVCKAAEIPASACRAFHVARRSILICEHEGAYYAHSALCPHQGNSLEGATLWSGRIDCPWHHYLFDVVTGENVYPRRVLPSDRPDLLPSVSPLKTFPLAARDGNLFVTLEPSTRSS